VRHHHERYDGKGYPDGLKGDEIPLGARILSVADAYQAMTEERPYRHALSQNAATAELIEGSGTQFDPRVVQAFLKVLQTMAEEEKPAPVVASKPPRV
jgi:HD-GYP domain-containing protein (c-di-GMP phosphodiesterase class II)